MHMRMTALFSYDRAIAAAHKGNVPQAERLIASALTDTPDSASHLYDAGVLAYKKGDAEHAATYFKQAAELSAQSDASLHEQALFNLGNSYVKQQKLEEALSTYEDLLRAHPDNERAKKNKEIVEELLKKKEEENKQEEQQKNNQNNQQQQDQKQQQGSGQNKDQNSNSQQKQDGSSEKQKSDGQNDQNDQRQGENGDQSENDSEGQDNPKDRDGQEDRNNGAGEQDKQQEPGRDDRQKQSPQSNQQNNAQQNAQQEQGAEEKKQAGGAGQEQKNNKSLQALDAALAEIVAQQDKQDAQLNKQLVKIMMDNQQPKRSKNGNTPRW